MATPLAQSTTTSRADLYSDSELKEKEEQEENMAGSTSASFVADQEKADPAASPPRTTELEPGSRYSNLRWTLVTFAVFTSSFLYGLDTTIVADVQASVIESFGAVEKLGWLGIGFPLGSIATILPLSKAFGIFDVKWLYVASLINFEAGSALCGGAPSMNALIIGRVWAGAGGAGMYLGLLNIFSINTPIHKRPLYMSGCGVIWGIGCILGPVIGGSFSDSSATWRWAFYINLVLFGVFSPVYFFVLDSYMPQPGVPLLTRLKHVDYLGVLRTQARCYTQPSQLNFLKRMLIALISVNAAVYTTFVMTFTFGGTLWHWSSGRTITLFVLFGLTLLTFITTQYLSILTTPKDRLFPGDFLKRRSLILLYIGTACLQAAPFIAIYYIPIFFQFTRGDNGVDAAVRLLPFVIINIFFVTVNGYLMPKFGAYMPWYFAAAVFIVIGGALMYATLDANTSAAKIYGFSVLIGIGAGLAQQAAYSVAAAKVPANRVSDAVGFINAAQIGSIVIALTITSSVFQNVGFRNVRGALRGLGFSAHDIHAALAGAKSAVFSSERVSEEVRERVIAGIVDAIRDGFILVIAAGALGLVTSLLMKRERLFLDASVGGA